MTKSDEIQVTPEMIEAGRRATRPEDDCPPDELMARIYRAMRALDPEPLLPELNSPRLHRPKRTLNAEQVDLIMDELRRLVRNGCTPEEAARKMHRVLLEEGYKI